MKHHMVKYHQNMNTFLTPISEKLKKLRFFDQFFSTFQQLEDFKVT